MGNETFWTKINQIDLDNKNKLIDKLSEQNNMLREVLEDITNEAKSYQERTGKSVTWLDYATKALEE